MNVYIAQHVLVQKRISLCQFTFLPIFNKVSRLYRSPYINEVVHTRISDVIIIHSCWGGFQVRCVRVIVAFPEVWTLWRWASKEASRDFGPSDMGLQRQGDGSKFTKS